MSREGLAELKRFDQGLHLSHCCVESSMEPNIEAEQLHHGCTTTCRMCLRCVWNSLGQAEKQARAEVLAAYSKLIHELRVQFVSSYAQADQPKGLHGEMFTDIVGWCERALVKLEQLQPAASDLEALLEQAHEAALPHAAEQLLKALTEGGEFAVGSPLDKAKKRVEALLREAELKGLRLGYCPSRHDIPNSPCKRCARIAELGKARASEVKQ